MKYKLYVAILTTLYIIPNLAQTSIPKNRIEKKNCDWVIYIGNISQYGSIEKQILLQLKGLAIRGEGTNCKEEEKFKIKIHSFEIRTSINKISYSESSNSSFFSKKQLAILNKVKVGSFVHIENIKIIATDGIRNAQPIYFRVT